jgi:hypothetical protein
VALRGHLVHGAGAEEFGIDGRVEMVRDGELTGIEFGVQVKTTSVGDRHAKVSVKTSTASYWRSRISPTLMMVYDDAKDVLWAEWVHALLTTADLDAATAKGQRTITFRLPVERSRLDLNGWARIEGEALARHESIQRLFSDASRDGSIQELYCRVADAADLLVDFMVWLALAPTTDLSQTLEAPTQPNGFELRRHRWDEERVSLPIILHVFDGNLGVLTKFVNAAIDAGNSPEHPILQAVGRLTLALQYFRDCIYAPDNDGRRGPAGGWGLADKREIGTRSGLTLLGLRDLQRQLRPWLFPAEATPPAPGGAHMARDLQPEDLVREAADRYVTPMDFEWSAYEAWYRSKQGES